MFVLGIESSCDETAAAVVTESGEVRAEAVASQAVLHSTWGGVVPEVASREHLRTLTRVTREVLTRCGKSAAELDGVAITCRPGLIGALLVGVQFGKALAWSSGVPWVGVDHLVGHLLSAFLVRPGPEGSSPHTDQLPEVVKPPSLPFVALLASGGHTALYRVDSLVPSGMRLLGATRDDAAGEAFDKVAKVLGLGYPGGPIVERTARAGDPSRAKLTRPMARHSTLEFSFSGLKTQVAQWVEAHPARTAQETADVCASFQGCVVDSLVLKLMAAARAEGVRDVVLGGGVAANGALRERARLAAEAAGLRLFVPELASCTDNAAMIAFAGAQRLRAGERDDLTLGASTTSVIPGFVRGRVKRGAR